VKIVFDTNIYVSIALDKRSAGGRAFEATLFARWRVYANQYLSDELERVLIDELQRPKHATYDLLRVLSHAWHDVPSQSSRHVVADDPKDTPILQLALQVGADFLVTRDKHLLSLNPYEKLRLISLASYYRMLEDHGLI
jgi:putative PIN family toxin of toxin-antitoxin system